MDETYDIIRAVRDERYKLIVGTGGRHRTDGYETGKPLRGPYVKLFDLKADPAETKDLAHSPEATAEKERLMRYLDERLRSTRKPDDQVPANLGRLEAIHWCLRPRD